MDVAREVAHGVLARREVAEGDVDLGVDQTRNRRRPAGVDHNVAGIDLRCLHHADGFQYAVGRNERISVDEGLTPVTRDDGAEIDDRDSHGSRGASLLAIRPSRMRSAPAQS